MLITEYLEKIGLSKKEAKVYLANLELGPSSIALIASRSGVKRTTVYEVMKSLKEKQLVSITGKGKKILYITTEPEKIKTILEQQMTLFSDILPQLRSLSKTARKRPTIQVFEGIEGLYSIYEDIIKEKKQLCSIVAFSKMQSDLSKKIAEEFVKDRVKHNIFAQVIAPDSKTSIEWQKIDKQSAREMRLIDKEKYPFSIEISIYGNKTAFISFKENELFGVIIQSAEITKTMKLMFTFFWASLGKQK
ncbi:hypothetical protein KKG22_04785 [Patescibacteria group bacterium]|nr:hypothetical protein [Patescibacteria group bacterium]MBU1721651.1 hypothetical protein [Patescibacteria group bacterium]MBU1901638.1 hypothetical protein [Patescibacteria group bacterium]